MTGPFCARCGQKSVRPDLTLGGFLHETTQELTNWDGKVPATLRTLFLRPGVLTIDFLAGRRARWLSPLRVYLICSLAFFGGRILLEELGFRTTGEMAGMRLTRDDEIAGPLTPEERQKVAEGPFGRIFGLERLERAAADSRRLNREFDSAIPRAMFLLLPIFALLTRLAFRRALPRYPAHLYAALHTHAAVFGAMLLFTAVASAIGSQTVATILFAAFVGFAVWYCLTAFRVVFGESLARTMLKMTAVGILYLFCLAVVGFSLLAITVLRM